MFFSDDQVKELRHGYTEIEPRYRSLLDSYAFRQFGNQKATEYANHGFLRRIKTLKRCIENVFSLCPPEREEKLSKDELTDLAINLQSFIFNLFGSIDNLAWIWVSEKDIRDKNTLPLGAKYIGLSRKNEIVRRSFSAEFQNYLTELNDWFNYLENYRHALAHRIPLYVPPFLISEAEAKESSLLEEQKIEALRAHNFDEYERLDIEQEAFGWHAPVMGHSLYEENSHRIVFHSQLLADWTTICEMAEHFLDELNK